MRIQKFFSIVLFFLIGRSFDAVSQTVNCARFRTGSFLYFNAAGDLMKVKRKKNTQVQFNLTKHSFAGKSDIKWMDSCSFQSNLVTPPVDLPPAIINIQPLTDSTFRSACSCGISDTTTWMVFSRTTIKRYKNTHEAF